MKVLTVITGLVGLVTLVVLLLLPTQISFFGTTASCGMPIVTAVDDMVADAAVGTDVDQLCVAQSKERVVLGVIVGAVLLASSVAMLLLPGGFVFDRKLSQ